MVVHTREQLMEFAAKAHTSAALRLYAIDGYERLESSFFQLALSSADTTLSDEAFLLRWEAFMSSAQGTSATDTRPGPKDERAAREAMPVEWHVAD